MNEIVFLGLSLNAWITLVTAFFTQLVMNVAMVRPGGYRFSDFMRLGVPLTLIITFAGIAAACLTFPLVPLQ